MIKKKIGLVAFGKMNSAIFYGLKEHCQNISVYNPTKEKVPSGFYKDFEDLIKSSDVVILGAKPQYILENIKQALPFLTKDKVFISIAAGIEVQSMKNAIENKASVVRSMPNLPVSIGKGVFALCFDDPLLNEEQKKEITEIFQLVGSVIALAEKEIDAFSGLVGCGPGFIFHLMEGFYQAAVTMGFSHKDARELTSQTFVGSTLLAEKEKDTSFYDLKQQVCSPKGITIKGVNHLEEKAVNSAITNAILIAGKYK